MNIPKEKIIGGVLGMIFLFSLHQYWLSAHIQSRFIVYENNLIIQSHDGGIFHYGGNTKAIKRIKQAIQPFFWESAHMDIADIGDDSYTMNEVSVHVLGTDIWYATIQDESILIVGANPDLTTASQSKKPLQADYWYITQDIFPQSFPMPQAIIWAQERKATKPIRNFAQENKIPLLETQITGEIMVMPDTGKIYVSRP